MKTPDRDDRGSLIRVSVEDQLIAVNPRGISGGDGQLRGHQGRAVRVPKEPA